MISVQAILFDLDGTLIDSKRDLARSIQHLQRLYNAPINSEMDVGTFIGDGVVKLVQRALPMVRKDDLDEAVTLFKNYYREHCLDHTRPYPGVRGVLKYYQQKNLAVVTNKPVRLSGYLLDELGLSKFFKVLVGGDSLPHKKPHPEPILNAIKTMRVVDFKRAVMVGDGPHDVYAGRAAGIYTCGIQSNIVEASILRNSRPDYLIQKMNELVRIFC